MKKFQLISPPEKFSNLNEKICNMENANKEKTQLLIDETNQIQHVAVFGKNDNDNVYVIYNMKTLFKYNLIKEEEGVFTLGLPSGKPGKLLHCSQHKTILEAACFVWGHDPGTNNEKPSN